jgi:ribonuclease HI
MSVPAPHFLLYSEAVPSHSPAGASAAESRASARWRFVLQSSRGEAALEVADEEASGSSERLELLAIIRGLEALDQPSRVTLMTSSRDIQRGLQFGLAQWREHDWHWERYGRMTPVKNGDLWRRIDRLLEIHDVACRPRRLEKADDLAAPQQAITPMRRDRRGRRLRIDQPGAKSNGRSTSAGSRPKFNSPRDGVARRLHCWDMLSSCLARISNFVLRIFAMGGALARKQKTRQS